MSRLIVSPHPQNTPEWYADRAGKLTGSRGDCVMAEGRTKGVEATTRRNYRVQLATERLTGKSLDEGGYESRSMRAGKENEPRGVMTYEVKTGTVVATVGFMYLASIPAGCSVDGLVDDDGFVEAKCPTPAVHIDYLMRARIPPEYVWQIAHNLWITDRKWCDFVSYCPVMPKKLQLLIVRVTREEMQNEITRYIASAMAFLAETKILEEQLLKKAA